MAMAGSIKGQIVAALGAIEAKPGESRHIDKSRETGRICKNFMVTKRMSVIETLSFRLRNTG